MKLTTEQMQSILGGATSNDIFWSTKEERYYRDLDFYMPPNDIKLSDIRAELSSRRAVQAYFACDERGSIEQEQSVIERLKQLKLATQEHLSKHMNMENSDYCEGITDGYAHVLVLIDELFKEVAGDE